VSNVESLPEVTHPTGDLLVEGDFFRTERHTLTGDSLALDTGGERFHALTTIYGTVTINEDLDLPLGRTAIIPAAVGAYRLHGEGVVLRSLPH
jgi:mannose-6-phosphate isomerase class I